jgi:hypothetical protein
MPNEAGKIVKAHCNDCSHMTNHRVAAQHEQREVDYTIPEDPQSQVIFNTTWDMLECCGCGSVTLRRTWSFSQTNERTVDYFPPRVSRRLPAWHYELPNSNMQSLLKEVYAALYADSRRLAMMGARTLIDMVFVEKVGDRGTFQQKLAELVAKGFVSQRNGRFLEAALDAGSAAAHRGHLPTAVDVNRVMDIIENLLQAVYLLENAAEELKKTTPPRA